MVTAVSTEDNILEAARQVFMQKGFAAARMCDIAKAANINPALLHYYFRSKERLFEAIFGEIIKFAFPKITRIIASDLGIVSKIEQFVDAYLEILMKHPFIPGFIMKELSRDPSTFLKMIMKFGFNPQIIFTQIEEAMDRGEIIRMDPRHLAVNVISMCVFPFAARPIISFVMFKEDQQAIENFYRERATVIKQFVVNAIVVKQ